MERNTVDILNRINVSVLEIAKSLKPQNQSRTETITKLSKGDVIDPKDQTQRIASPKISMNSVGDLIKVISALSPSIKSLAKLDGKITKSFKSVIKSVINSMNTLFKFSDENKDAIGKAKGLVEVMDVAVKGINKMPMLIVTAPLALVGLTMSIPVFLIYGKLLQTISRLSFGKADKKNINSLVSAVNPILKFTAGAVLITVACIGLGILIMKGDTQKLIMGGLVGLGAVLLTLTGMILITGLASKIIQTSGAFGGVKDILLMTVASMGIIIASKFLGDFVLKNKDGIITGLAATGGVMIGLVGIAALASKLLKSSKQGIIALAVMEGIAIGSMGIILAALKLNENTKGKTKDIALTILGCIGVITAFGSLAAAASFIAPEILIGSIAIGSVVLFALGTIKLMNAILKFNSTKKESGIDWKTIIKDVIGMESVMGSFGILATTFGLMVVPITLAIPSMLVVTKFANSCIGITRDVAKLNDTIKGVGGIDNLKKTVGVDMTALLKQFNAKNFKIEMSLLEMGSLALKFTALNLLTSQFSNVAVSLSKVSQVAGIIDDKGRISPVLYVDKKTGEIRYGTPVDIKNVANVITGTVKTFVEQCNYSFEQVKGMLKTALIFKLIGTIVDPISTFVNVLTGFVGGKDGSGNNTLAPVTISSDGNINIGEPVDVKKVASTIAGTISSFVNELYNEENAGSWAKKMYGDSSFWDKVLHGGKNKQTRAIKNVAGILGMLVTPITEFIDVLTSLYSADGKSLNKLNIDADGNVTQGQNVDVVKISTAMANAVNTFINNLYGAEQIDKWANNVKKGGKSFDEIISSLNSFAGTISIFSDKNKINDVSLNKNGLAINNFLKTIINEDLDRGVTVLDKFDISLTKTTASIKNVDKVLKDDQEKRKKAIDEFKDSIEDLLKKFSGADNSISKLYELIMALQNMDANKVSSIIASMNLNNYKGSNIQTTQAVGSSTTNVSINEPKEPIFTLDDFTDAIRTVFDTAKIKGEVQDNSGNVTHSVNYTMDVN